LTKLVTILIKDCATLAAVWANMRHEIRDISRRAFTGVNPKDLEGNWRPVQWDIREFIKMLHGK
jgi:hypothetical protein